MTFKRKGGRIDLEIVHKIVPKLSPKLAKADPEVNNDLYHKMLGSK